MDKEYIFVDNYGEVLAQVNSMELVEYKEYGSYQGDYLVILKHTDKYDNTPPRLFYYKGSYGSCSGCDWLEGEGNEYSYTGEGDIWKEQQKLDKRYAVKYTSALEYCGDIKPLFIVPADKPLEVEENTEDYFETFKLS